MAFLLDTHAFLWFASGDSQLPDTIKSKIMDINEICYTRVASLWEITIKSQLGKLNLEISLKELFEYADRNQIIVIQITHEHLLTLAALPSYHNDPFDRLIIAQTITENLTLISRDNMIKKYDIKQQWS